MTGETVKNNNNAQPDCEAQRLWQALSSFAGRMAKTDDPREHQDAAVRLREELREHKIRV